MIKAISAKPSHQIFLLIFTISLIACSKRYTSEREVVEINEPVMEEVNFILEHEIGPEPAPVRSSVVHALNTTSDWVDSVFNSLTPEEKIGQLIMVQAFSNMDKRHEDSLMRAIKTHKVGGLVVSLGGPVRQAKLINRLQKAAKVPLLLAMDAEWGLGMRLDSTISFPFQMTLGAIQNDSLIYVMGKQVADHFKRIGMHVNFAPVVDVNNNPKNPIINYRSFGENKYKVADKGLAYMRGMQSEGILAVAKHFPGHGDTDVDSHYALPLISHNRERIDSLELYPFREMINNGIGGVMVAHLNIPELDPQKNLPSTLSKSIVTNLLKEELGFNGLIFTDAMNMKGVTRYFPQGEGDVKAIIAGNDVLEITEDAAKAISKIKTAILKGEIFQEEIDVRCKKVLAAKYWAGLNHYAPIEIENLVEELNTEENKALLKLLAEASVTVLKNENNLFPILNSDQRKIASLAIGASSPTIFQSTLTENNNITHYYLPKNGNAKTIASLKEKLKNYDLVVTGIYGPSKRPNTKLGFSNEVTSFIKEIASSDKSIITAFTNAYALTQFGNLNKTQGLILTYELNPYAEEAAANVISGKIGTSGKLPVTVGTYFNSGEGIVLPNLP